MEYHFPQIAGAIDGSHIEIRAPPDNHEDYYNQKQFYSLVLQGAVDSKLLFRHISVGYPGSVHDLRVLRLSGLADLVEKGQILKSPTKIIQGVEVRPMLAGDSPYPLPVWLLKPFSTRGNILRQEKKINEKFSAMRAVVERAFRMLKGRWRILSKKTEQHYKSVSRTITAACVLHNFCQMQSESYDLDLRNPPADHDDNDEGVALGGGAIFDENIDS